MCKESADWLLHIHLHTHVHVKFNAYYLADNFSYFRASVTYIQTSASMSLRGRSFYIFYTPRTRTSTMFLNTQFIQSMRRRLQAVIDTQSGHKNSAINFKKFTKVLIFYRVCKHYFDSIKIYLISFFILNILH